MLFHLGALWRLNEAGYLPQLERDLERLRRLDHGRRARARTGTQLELRRDGVARRFEDNVVDPLARSSPARRSTCGRSCSGSSCRARSATGRRSLRRAPASATRRCRTSPTEPRFVFNATNLQSGALWRFSKPYMRDYRVGEIENPTSSSPIAVAASSAFPPLLSPRHARARADATRRPGAAPTCSARRTRRDVVLTDGGVYDNLGLETAWKRYETVLVSDGGGRIGGRGRPGDDWTRQSHPRPRT